MTSVPRPHLPKVDPALHGLLQDAASDEPFDVVQMRAGLAAFARAVAAPAPDPGTEDTSIGDVRVRRYRPAGPPRGPALVWCHGGGYVTGSVDAIDPLCRSLVARTRAPLTSVDYRLAPEHPFPAALDDCVSVVRTLAKQGPVAVGGDSAGAGLAAAACLVLRDEDLPVVGQLLVVPFLDLTLSQPSIELLGSGYGLTRDALASFAELYLGGADARDPRCSPLLAGDLCRMPPAVVVTAECDPLRDEGEVYAARLQEAGVAAVARRYPGMLHGFVGMSGLTPVADEAQGWMVEELARLTDG